MQLTEHRNERQLFVRKADASSVVIIDRLYTTSLALSATQVIEDFRARRVEDLDALAVEQVLKLGPEVVLLGTGARITFPPPAVLAEFLKRRIGLEAMDNAAAARTFNVLIGEGRQAVAVFLLPG
jgi:uncharacterized protein